MKVNWQLLTLTVNGILVGVEAITLMVAIVTLFTSPIHVPAVLLATSAVMGLLSQRVGWIYDDRWR